MDWTPVLPFILVTIPDASLPQATMLPSLFSAAMWSPTMAICTTPDKPGGTAQMLMYLPLEMLMRHEPQTWTVPSNLTAAATNVPTVMLATLVLSTAPVTTPSDGVMAQPTSVPSYFSARPW
jgi:hypothetical protein